MSAATYKATWIAMVDAFRSVPGTDFRFDYNINAGTGNNVNGRSNFDSFPGNAYVDYIGEDIYDNTDSVAAAQAEITDMTNFAQVMGLPWSLPEWGMNGPDDDPAFVNMISSETNQSTCWEEALFSEPWSSSGLGSNILDLPNSAAAIGADFGSATTSTTDIAPRHRPPPRRNQLRRQPQVQPPRQRRPFNRPVSEPRLQRRTQQPRQRPPVRQPVSELRRRPRRHLWPP